MGSEWSDHTPLLQSAVAKQLPKKTEQVLFCHLTDHQRQVYRDYLRSNEVQLIYEKRFSLFSAIHVLRKVCNHPDLLQLRAAPGEQKHIRPSDVPDYGSSKRSGKLQIVRCRLPALWAHGPWCCSWSTF